MGDEEVFQDGLYGKNHQFPICNTTANKSPYLTIAKNGQ
jgi:hypothetical protein